MVSMHMGIASMVLLQAVRAGCAPRCAQPRVILHGYEMDKLHVWPGIPVPMRLVCLCYLCLLVTMGMDMNEWLIAWIVLL